MWPKCPEFILEDGRKIRLVEMFRENIYHSLLEGSPYRGHNYSIIQGLLHRERSSMKWATEGHPPVLLPTRLWNRKERTWDLVDWYNFQGHPAEPPRMRPERFDEWMPGIGTVALFISDPIRNDPEDGDASYLSVIWFQKGFEDLIEEQPHADLKLIPWDAMARSWIF